MEYKELKSKLTQIQTEILQFIWEYAVSSDGKWPPIDSLHRAFNSKLRVENVVASMPGGCVLRSGGGISETYFLNLLGVLLAQKNLSLETLIGRFLSYARDSFKKNGRDKDITSQDLRENLPLFECEISLLGTFLRCGYLPITGGSSLENTGEWSIELSQNVSELLDFNNMSEYLEKITMNCYQEDNISSAESEENNGEKSLPEDIVVNVKRMLVDLMNGYLEIHGKNPTRIYITRLFENKMNAAGSECWGKLAAISAIKGIREALGKPSMFGGCLLIWDSDELKADRVKEDLQIIEGVMMKTSPTGKRKFKYDVALSFAGEQRSYVEEVNEYLKYDGVRTFYDHDRTVESWGKNLIDDFDEVFRISSRYCVMFISKEYKDKSWTNHERKSALARALEERSEYVLPARFDDTELAGLIPTIHYIDLSNLSPKQFAKMIIEKIGLSEA